MRYLVAADRRPQRCRDQHPAGHHRMEKVHEMQDEYAWLLEQMPRAGRSSRSWTSAG